MIKKTLVIILVGLYFLSNSSRADALDKCQVEFIGRDSLGRTYSDRNNTFILGFVENIYYNIKTLQSGKYKVYLNTGVPAIGWTSINDEYAYNDIDYLSGPIPHRENLFPWVDSFYQPGSHLMKIYLDQGSGEELYTAPGCENITYTIIRSPTTPTPIPSSKCSIDINPQYPTKIDSSTKVTLKAIASETVNVKTSIFQAKSPTGQILNISYHSDASDTTGKTILSDARSFPELGNYTITLSYNPTVIPCIGDFCTPTTVYAGECKNTFQVGGYYIPPTITLTPSPVPVDPPDCKDKCFEYPKHCEESEKCRRNIDCMRNRGFFDCTQCSFCKDYKDAIDEAASEKPIPTLTHLCDSIDKKYLNDCVKCVNPTDAADPTLYPNQPYPTGGDGGIWTAAGCIPTSVQGVLNDYIFRYGIGIAGGIAFLYFIFAAFTFMTSGGNPERVEQAKQMITSALSGLILIIFSVYLLRLIGVYVFEIPGFKSTNSSLCTKDQLNQTRACSTEGGKGTKTCLERTDRKGYYYWTECNICSSSADLGNFRSCWEFGNKGISTCIFKDGIYQMSGCDAKCSNEGETKPCSEGGVSGLITCTSGKWSDCIPIPTPTHQPLPTQQAI